MSGFDIFVIVFLLLVVLTLFAGVKTVIVDGQETVLGAMDSCTIAPHEVREIINRTNHVCKMLVVVPYPPGVKP